MKLAICPVCGELIDFDLIKILDPDTVIGCGQEGEFIPCNKCGCKFGSEFCQELRDENGWMPMVVADYKKRPKGL